jgi:glycosyltransferase involved in cell wall biosynthesis
MICCSEFVAREFARSPGVPKSILRAVSNCASVDEIHRQAEQAREKRDGEGPRIVMVATLEAHKDHATLMRAMPEVVRAIPSARLSLAGDGSLRAMLEKLRDSLGLGDSVHFLGTRRDVPALLGQSDVFVLSTTADEGFGTVLIEAMAAGIPIVASDVPACREVLESGRWGRLVPPGDPGALAAALIGALRAGRSAETAGRMEHLRQYSPPNMIAAYVASSS